MPAKAALIAAIVAVSLSGCAFLDRHAANYWYWCEPNCDPHR
jgi:hypothetical protein